MESVLVLCTILCGNFEKFPHDVDTNLSNSEQKILKKVRVCYQLLLGTTYPFGEG